MTAEYLKSEWVYVTATHSFTQHSLMGQRVVESCVCFGHRGYQRFEFVRLHSITVWMNSLRDLVLAGNLLQGSCLSFRKCTDSIHRSWLIKTWYNTVHYEKAELRLISRRDWPLLITTCVRGPDLANTTSSLWEKAVVSERPCQNFCSHVLNGGKGYGFVSVNGCIRVMSGTEKSWPRRDQSQGLWELKVILRPSLLVPVLPSEIKEDDSATLQTIAIY